MQCGPIAYKSDNKTALEKHSFEHYMIPRFTSFYSNHESIQELYADLADNEIRNDIIVRDCIDAVNEGRTPIILTERTSHVDVLAEKLSDYKVVKLIGGMGNKYNTEMLSELNAISDKDKLILIATGKYVGEGFDFPRLDTLLLVMPISWKGTLQQYAGRLHREYEEKNEVRIYDYIDIHVPMLEKMYQKRLKGYNSIGYKIKCSDSADDKISSIYNVADFSDVFATDIIAAYREIIIVSPFVSKREINKLMSAFEPVIDKLTVITKPETEYKKEDAARRAKECIDILKSCGINIKVMPKVHQKFAVIDRRLVWYGSINFLGFSAIDESAMRLENKAIAEELIRFVE